MIRLADKLTKVLIMAMGKGKPAPRKKKAAPKKTRKPAKKK